MNRTFILFEGKFAVHDIDISQIIGVVSQEKTANRWWSNDKDNRFYKTFQIDDPELLNKIAKENK